MAHVIVPNFVANAPQDNFSVVWKLTRAMKRAGWVYKASADGVTKDATGNPANDKWGGGVTSFAGGSGASISAKTTDVLTVEGLTGLTPSVVGHYITISGSSNSANNGTFQVLTLIDATSVTVRNANASAAVDAGPLAWVIKDPLLDTIPTINAGGWWCAQGPSTLKIPFTAAPTGVFLRGEKVTQASTNTEGELVGITFDPLTGAGWAVILPRVTGTGASARGWSNSGTITGTSSGATFTPSGTISEYVREVVFISGASGSVRQMGAIYFSVLDAASEGTQRYSYLASNAAGCTATVAPGGGGTGNTFPASTGAFVVLGTGGSMSGYGYWCNNNGSTSYSSYLGNAQIIAANCMELPGQSADGSLFCAMQTASVNAYSHTHFTFQRCDDTEEGDVDPFIWYIPASSSSWYNGGWNRTVLTDMDDYQDTTSSHGMVRRERGSYRGTRRRGLLGESFQVYCACALYLGVAYVSSGPVMNFNPIIDPETVASAATTMLVRDPIYLVSANFRVKARKGTLRWIYLMQGQNPLDTYENRKWVGFGLVFSGANNDGIGLAVGPWDGVTVPTFASY